ncbi:hypothetical protein [Segniliparus rugosus]|uniref:Uncharacterized protein n=1 Tax=Segniliparus rugosus (strain ATCC BAA-974 / DSM 45345 / CCUG 50838 / CIP 108380 / JCM 13579 / CDC 945) TaxID=679197 RepID=E5XQR3_SEGRC|nr:hypothetical protein [Segniliparus rugosus]EFV13324.1 hypothetical protein HMPREF9336_01835 [Segniliparus rugosus ATCC BAA-974]
MSSPYRPGNPDDPGQRYPPPAPPSPYAQYPPPSPYAQHYPGPHEFRQPSAAKPKKNKALLFSILGVALVVALAAVAGVLLSNRADSRSAGPQLLPTKPTGPGAPASSSAGQSAQGSSLLGMSGEDLLPLMPTAADFPQGTKVQAFIDTLGEANADDRVKPLPPEATNPPSCWTHLEIRKNRDDLPDITRIVTTLDKNDKGQTLAAAQIAKENNNADAIEQAKAWLARCQEFDYVYQLKDGQPPVHFKLAPLSGPPAFSDPFFGVKLTEFGPQGPLGYRYFFAARVRGLLVLSEGVCDLSTCDETQDARLAQQIPIMFSKIVQGLRNLQ